MKKFIFDVDGTLTPSRGKIDPEFSPLFWELTKSEEVYLVTGSDRQKTLEQVTPEIYNNCKHKQKRSLGGRKLKDMAESGNARHRVWAKELIRLDNSDWCVDLLIDYHGKSTLGKYIATHNLTTKQTYSFIFQIIKIIMILYKGGYSNNDLHNENIMIQKTNQKYFE